MSEIANTIFSPELAARFDHLVTIYPAKRSALVPMLLYAQDEVGYVSDFLPFVINVTAALPNKANIVSGNNHSGKPGQTLTAPFVVQITTASGTPLPQIPVSWKVLSGTVTLSQVSNTTNANGQASALGTIGGTAGQVQVQVTAGSGANQVSATFTATITIPVGGVQLVSGNSQSTNENTAFPNPLVVAVTDTNGNPVAGQAVTFTVTSGTATVSSPTATTGANGQASTTITAGATAGAFTRIDHPARFSPRCLPPVTASMSLPSGSSTSIFKSPKICRLR